MLRILLVEDNLSDSRLAVRALESARLTTKISVVRDGLEALDFLSKKAPFENAEKPGLILLDLNLPRMDGYELLVHLKAKEEFSSIPVVVLSTSTSSIDRARCFALNIEAYITKPMRYEDFSELIDKVKSFC